MNIDIVPFTNKKLKKIVNVYQLNYKDNKKSPGLGDYLRGCFCLMQLSKLLKIDFDLDISNHPLSKYIENPKRIDGIDYNNIQVYDLHNRRNGANNYEGTINNINKDFLDHIINYLNCQDCEAFGLFSNAFTIFNAHSEEGKQFVRSRLRPNKIMRDYVDQTLNNLGLSKKGYGVIHLRTGDKYLVSGQGIDFTFVQKIKTILLQNIQPNRRYLIISDSNVLKRCLKNMPNFYLLVKDIEHLGGEALRSTETDGVKNTMLDFFLMEHSNAILALSIYDHVSGFSKYCAIINNIPIKYIKINV